MYVLVKDGRPIRVVIKSFSMCDTMRLDVTEVDIEEATVFATFDSALSTMDSLGDGCSIISYDELLGTK